MKHFRATEGKNLTGRRYPTERLNNATAEEIPCSAFRLWPRSFPSLLVCPLNSPANPAQKRSTGFTPPRGFHLRLPPIPSPTPPQARSLLAPTRATSGRHRRSGPTDPGSPAPELPRPLAAIGCSASLRASDLFLGLPVKQRAVRPGTAAVRRALPALRPGLPGRFLRRRGGRRPAHCGAER